MKKTVIYIRQSLGTDKQPYSLSMQKDMALTYAERHEWIIHDIYDEGNRSARKTKLEERPELKRLLNDIQAGKIHRVLVFKRDRLARKVQQYIEIYRMIKKHKVELHFVADNEPPPFEGAASEFIEAILAGIAEHEANNIVQRLIYSKIPLIKKGLWQVGSPPYAYDSIKKKHSQGVFDNELETELKSNLSLNPARQEIVRTLYYEVDSIASDFLDKQNFSLVCDAIRKNKVLNTLTNKQIYDIIIQPLHIGEMNQRLDGIEYKINNELTQSLRILLPSEERLWFRANEFLGQLRVPDSYRSDKSSNEEIEEELPLAKLEGALFCGKCKKPLVVRKKVYKCMTKECKNAPKISKVDEEVFQEVWTYLVNKGDVHWGKLKTLLESKYKKPFDARISYLAKQRTSLEKKIKVCFQNYLLISSDEHKIRLSDHVSQYKKVSKELEKYESLFFHIKNFLDNLDKDKTLGLIREMSFTEIQKVNILSLVKEVHYHNKRSSNLGCFVPRVEVKK